MARPLLDPPSPAWKRDLPGPNEVPERPPQASYFGYPPNHKDESYLELSRSTLLWRGVLVWIGTLCLGVTVVLLFTLANAIAAGDIEIVLAGLATVAVGALASGVMIRHDLTPPRDEPIRFNRQRRKVYVYRFHHCWWNPFDSKRWGVRPVVYNWDDLRAEVYSVYVPTVTYNTGVSIAVVKPDTNQVIERFCLSHHATAERDWALAQVFMQQGPHALPKFDRPPRDWNNEDPGLNLARRFAPKVAWPVDMDIESRTAP